jgi:excisionase family DNA binding protein
MSSTSTTTTSGPEAARGEWLTPREAAQEHNVGPRTIYNAIRRGELRAAPVNQRGDLRIKRAWLDDWLERKAREAERAAAEARKRAASTSAAP